MMAISLPVHLTPVEIFRSLFNGSMLCRKTGIKSSSVKSDSQLPGYLTAFSGLLVLSVVQRMLAVACLAICVLPISDAMAAEVFTKDQGLQGSVVGVTAEGVEFQTIYGKGAILIQWSDIEMILSDKEFLVLFGEDQETIGRLWGLANGQLMVGPDRASAIRIPVDQIYRSFTRDQYEKSRLDRLRARFRYWTANFDLAFALTDATTDTTSFSTALEIRRKKKPIDFFIRAYYFFGTAKKSGAALWFQASIRCRVPAGHFRLAGQLPDPCRRRLDDADHRLAGLQNRAFLDLHQQTAARYRSQQLHDYRRTFVSILIKQQQVKQEVKDYASPKIAFIITGAFFDWSNC